MSQNSSARPLLGTTDFSTNQTALAYFVRSRILKMRTSGPVIVERVTNDGGLSPIGRVSIRPLVQQVDGRGNAINHDIIHNVPYLRIQGGANAVILDPEVGDIGMALFADRDISSVKASGQQSPPGSSRMFNMADAVYMGAIIAAAPEQYVQFSADGITLHSPTKVRIEAPVSEVEAPTMSFIGNAYFTGNVGVGGTLENAGVNVGSNHTHTGVQTGSGTSGAPSQ